MADQFERVSRPTANVDSPGVSPPRGLNRNNLTLFLSIAAALLSVLSGAVGMYRWLGGERDFFVADTAKLNAEASKIEIDRQVSKVEVKYAEPIKDQELQKLRNENNLLRQQLLTERAQQYKNTEEAQLAANLKIIEGVRARIHKEVVEPWIPTLRRSMICAMDPKADGCDFMRSPVNPRPIVPPFPPPSER
jgi:hypothetical protein